MNWHEILALFTGHFPRRLFGHDVAGIFFKERHKSDTRLVVIPDSVSFDDVLHTTSIQNSVTHGQERNINCRSIRLIVVVHQVANNRGLALGVAQFVATTVRHNARTVIAEN